MKIVNTLTAMLLIVVICFCISSCDTSTTTGSDETTKTAEVTVTDRNTSSDSETESDSGTETTDDNTTLEPVIPEVLPVYIDGTIKLFDRNKQENSPVNRQKRKCYYSWVLEIQDYISVDSELEKTWTLEFYGRRMHICTEEPTEMAFVSFIKEFNIPRDVMEKALEKLAEEYDCDFASWGYDNEYSELPNLDIIYTLDNKIINEYYRYA